MAIEADEYVGKANVQYDDWTGTAAADSSDMAGLTESLKKIGFDTDRWSVIGIEIYQADLNKDGLYIIALDRTAMQRAGHKTLDEYSSANGGELPVTNFLVHGVPTVDLIASSFKRFAVNLVARHVPRDTPLHIVSRDDINYSGL
ncbi:hypothetical protein [Agreia sp. COWG]|uniref:hypothetical protein n=1 Tax=Agreia sp. COWG TaxID=2773266 RepID=UPI0019273303|nr:hypothetical protein [Agreia sp. COWG]CAD6005322.1 conserved protein of unknown function [Agreia sp. COWG]